MTKSFNVKHKHVNLRCYEPDTARAKQSKPNVFYVLFLFLHGTSNDENLNNSNRQQVVWGTCQGTSQIQLLSPYEVSS